MSGETLAFAQLALGRWVWYGGAALVVGAAAFLARVAPAVRDARGLGDAAETVLRRSGDVALLGAAVVLAAHAWRLYAQTYSVFGLDEPVTLGLARTVAFGTSWGAGWMGQTAAAVLAVVCLAGARRASGTARVALTVAAATATAATVPLTGHAMAEGRAAFLAVAFQIVHVAAAGTWVGGIVHLLAAAWPPRRGGPAPTGEVARAMLPAFSDTALLAVVALAGSGLITAVMYLPALSALWETAYGRTLLGKFGLFLTMGAVGAYNWRVAKPAVERGDPPGRLFRSAVAELAVADLVLAVTAVLVALPLER